MNRTKEKPAKAEKASAAKPEKNGKAKKSKEVALSNGAVDHRLSESFPMIKLIEQRIAESVPKEIIAKVNAVTSKRQIICSTYPYEKCIKNKAYEKEAKYLQIELVKMQAWVQKTGAKVVMLFEGRDAAGKGGTIKRFTEFLNPRGAPVVALTKPSESERGQWYFQRYVEHLPAAGEIVIFDRSWYNRAGVERVMGFATKDQVELFLKEAPRLESMLIDEGIRLIKIYVDVGLEMQLKRFHERQHNPLKIWKISDIDRQAMTRYADYTEARDRMLETTHSDLAPWTIVFGNDKKRARLSVIRHILGLFDYPGKDRKAIGEVDGKILGLGPAFALNFGLLPK